MGTPKNTDKAYYSKIGLLCSFFRNVTNPSESEKVVHVHSMKAYQWRRYVVLFVLNLDCKWR